MGWAIFMLWAAYLLDLIIGDPRSLPHPVIGMGNGIKRLEKVIRKYISHPVKLKRAGILLPIIIVGGSFLITWIVLRGLYLIHPWLAAGVEVFLIATTIATKGLKDAGMEVYGHLHRGDLSAARRSLGMIVGRDTAHLDEPEIVRGTVETVAENIVDAIVSPLFFALIGGAPLAVAYRAVNTLDSMVGYKNDKYINLGWASARLDDIANYIPARITALLLVASSWIMRLDYKKSYRTIRHDARLHPSPNSGFPESAVAGALGIRLGGENVYHGVVSFRAYMGELSRPMTKGDIQSTVRLMLMASLLFLVVCMLFLWMIGGNLWS
ncbi:adenosylcobinamide-phosphate synthase CbiB [Paenibacillus antarcticus]|uniref:Cobalamin biosynthesis protein CobD n=1 Tax=Paenibacillus antarcticus TaxID=253703 RepID=A0A168QXK4_9BACL|nr:adenosylcobinamide-phosphate synthase CbiB [Paenibacillus antarcticus]OAB48334.1 adenosylcobinamide-phosphate synthase [Paenibacillus antarcticus]